MIAAFRIGLVGGQRAMTPLAAVAIGLARGELPARDALTRFLARPLVAGGALALAVGEMAGDKQKTAPDRIVPLGLAARMIMAGFACGSLAPRGQFWKGAAVGATTAVAASYPGWYARITAMEEYGQTPTGLVEDAIVIAGAAAIMAGVRRDAI